MLHTNDENSGPKVMLSCSYWIKLSRGIEQKITILILMSICAQRLFSKVY